MHSKWLTFVGAMSLCACTIQTGEQDTGATDGEAIGDLKQEIIDGVPITGAGASQQWEGIVQLWTPAGSCTGEFISGQHVLTAGHCFAAGGSQSVWLRAPTWDSGNWHEFPSSWVGVQGTARAVDVAVITLSSSPAWATSGRRFRLFTGGTTLTTLNIYGYGAYDHAGNSDGSLRGAPDRATIAIVDHGDGYFKANVHTARICLGDSGGPAIKEGSLAIVWGIAHSFTFKSGTNRACPTPDHEMTWTKTNSNMAFIESQLGYTCSRFTGDGQAYARCW